MAIRCGTRLLGHTDRVTVGRERKPIFHVATKFFHVNFIPFVPLGSCLVLDFLQPNRAVGIPTSAKSIGISWLRCIAWYSALILGILTFCSVLDSTTWVPTSWQLPLCFFLALGLASFVTWHGYLNDASYERAIELLGHVSLGPRFDAIMKTLVDESFVSQFTDNGQIEALALAVPTETTEQAPHGDLELAEGSAVQGSSDGSSSHMTVNLDAPDSPEDSSFWVIRI